MKNPHNKSEYVKVDDSAESVPQETAQEQTAPVEPNETSKKEKKDKKPKFSGAYYYVDKDERTLASMSFARTSLTIASFMLQLIALLMPEQAGAIYVSQHITSYALIYAMVVIFGVGCVSLWLMVMNQIRYKFAKRITYEYAPRKGFKNRAFFGLELHMGIMAAMAAFHLSFVCIRYDGWGLGAFFISLASLGASVAAREITHKTLKDAEYIPPAAEE